MSNAVKCPSCDFPSCRATSTKTGGYSLSCPECGFQGFAKSPKAAAGIARQLAGGSSEPAAAGTVASPAKKPAGDFLSEL